VRGPTSGRAARTSATSADGSAGRGALGSRHRGLRLRGEHGRPPRGRGLYWKAYAQRKAGRPADALATLGQLRKTAPQSKYIKEADNLEQEIRQQASGQPPAPERASNDDEKLIAINTLLTTNAEQAVPMLEKFLSNPSASPKLRNRALFVLTQSGSPRGRAVVADIARGKSHPDMQRTAVKYLGLFGGDESRQSSRDLRLDGGRRHQEGRAPGLHDVGQQGRCAGRRAR
jgi:hypothetical protein